ncbi:nitroreductase family protein [Capnocytophaga canimorsus]|uniref:nitroreductase family protein n=1 Tax=Capnocytophaga canimorsus TaxID=28188 RepID=UPI00156298B8|nr:nitroreductase family protein [Capnocytophaga canimorsus]
MNLKDILNYRRAVRLYDETQPIETEKVRECLELAQLAPTSSNMQLWEAYHVTDKSVLAKLTESCLSQSAAKTAQQMVVFVTRQDLYKERAKAILEFEKGNVQRNSPSERQAKRIKDRETYYGKLMPFLYHRCFGLLGWVRKIMVLSIGLFRPIVRQVSEAEVRTVVHKSCALAVQTFMIAMAEKQYDTCPLEGFDSKLVKKALKLPSDTEINMIITCGIRKEGGIWGERFRVPFEEVYHQV